jgi:hypothetical protein
MSLNPIILEDTSNMNCKHSSQEYKDILVRMNS